MSMRTIKWYKVGKVTDQWPDDESVLPEVDVELSNPSDIVSVLQAKTSCKHTMELYMQTPKLNQPQAFRWQDVETVSELPQGDPLIVKVVASSAAPTAAGSLDAIKAALTEVLNARDARGSSSNSSQRFSAVGSTAAQQFYNMNNIAIADGNQLDPLPGDSLDCGSFDMSKYPDEQFATPPFLQHIEQSLKKNNVITGRNGFSVMDVRNQNRMYQLRWPSGQVLSGGLDGAVLPHGLMADSARSQRRCGIEVKHSDAHKAAYKDKQAGKPVAGTESSVQFTGQVKGQALMEIVAAAVYAEYPEVMLLHSSYDDNVVLLFSEGVTIWQGCSFNAAMAKMASFLQTCSSERRYAIEQHDLAQSEAVKPVLQLRKKLKLASSLIEQLDSVTAGLDQGAKFSTALEFFLAARYSELVQAHVHASSSHDGPNMVHGASYIS